jgi:hypothetical protein
MSHVIHCPSGLSGSIRGLKVREERFLADRKLAKAGTIVDELLRACWLETSDAGPYEFADGKVTWDKVLQGDRFYTLVELRTLTYGPDYAFAVTCRESGCRARIDWEINLRDLPVRALTDDSRASFVGGNRFETRLPGAGSRVWFRLFTGADERRLPALRKQAGERMLSAMLSFRVVEIEGVDERERRRFLEELSMRDADFLVDEFDRVDCGVETSIEIECPECFARQDVQLPFDQTFFMPAKGRTARRRDRTESSPT